MLAGADMAATSAALILFVVGTDISHAQLQLQVDVLAQQKGIAIRKTHALGEALVAIFRQGAKVGAQKRYFVVEIAEVVGAVDEMSAYEVTGEAVAEPVTRFGLNKEMFPFDAGISAPRVVISR